MFTQDLSRAGQPLRGAWRARPSVELLEDRCLLAAGFVQGLAFVDSNGNGLLDPGESHLAGATVSLYSGDGSNLLATTTTNAAGYFVFNQLAPGNYRIVETPPTGYANSGSQAISQIDTATVLDKNTIAVSVVDPIQLTVTFNAATFFGRHKWELYTYQFFGHEQENSVGQYPLVVTGPNGFNTTYLGLCADLFHSFLDDVNRFGVFASLSPDPNGPGSPHNWGQIGYLYNHFGLSDLSKVDAAGLQIAIWELEYNTTVDFESGNINSFTPQPPTRQADLDAALARATFFINASAGQSEPVLFLDATQGGQTKPLLGLQGVIAGGTLNFGNTVIPSSGGGGGSTGGGSTGQIGASSGSTPVSEVPSFPLTPVTAPSTGMVSKLGLFGSNMMDVNGTERVQAAFVEWVYQNLLNRMADSDGLAHWVQLLQAGFSRQDVATAIWQSPEHRGLEVDHFYATILHRSADAGGREFWVGAMVNGESEQQVIEGLLLSPEYQAFHGTDLAFVQGLYADALGRTPDATGLASWLQALQSGTSRAAIAQAFVTSTEAERTTIDSFYAFYLRRSADSSGEQFWLGQLQSGRVSLEGVGEAILASDEYFSQFASM
jgi:hypothetical protein